MRKLVVILVLLGAAPGMARAATQLNGYYEAFAQGTREDETWQLNMPNHYVEIRALTTPFTNVEGFIEISASSNRFRSINPGIDPTTQTQLESQFVHDPQVAFNEGHVKLRGDHAEVLVFSSQNRFWFSQPLLNVVDGNTLQDDFYGPRSQGLRLDFWNMAGFGGLSYYGDKATNGEDFVAGRIWRNFSDNRIILGTTYGRKDFGNTTSDYDLTAAVDVEFALGDLFDALNQFGRTTFVVEAARNFSGWVDDDELRSGVQAELRDFRIGALSFKTSAWYREPFLYTGMSSRQGDDDRRGYFVETWYRLPHKQVNLRYAHWRNRALRDFAADGSRFDENQHEVEAYMELKGNFSAWVKWRRYEGNGNLGAGTVFKNLVLEVQGQNKLISVRPQMRLRDYGTPFSVQGYGMEVNLNLTSRWKFFARFLNADENTESRRTFFVQARYDAWSNAEFFLEYGDGGRSDRLTENDSFVSEGPSARDQDSERRIQLIMKMWY
jgi:hypothetical protein